MEQNTKNLCPTCRTLDLDALFDVAQFQHLPQPQLAGSIPCTEYVRKVTTFTAESLKASAKECPFCSFLLSVSSRARERVASALRSEHRNLTRFYDPRFQDGDGFTLAASSSRFLQLSYLQAAETRPMVVEETASKPQPSSHLPPSTSPVELENWLFVLRGSRVLERLACELETSRTSDAPLEFLRAISAHIETTGTCITEAAETDIVSDTSTWRHYRCVSSTINYGLLQSWLNSCITNHPSCAISKAPNAPIPHMKLIDCHSRMLVAAQPNMSYLALSYVWGKGPADKVNYPYLPSPLPQTIEDTITVAREIGMRYVWIDRYCIRQDDWEHKMSQILQMTNIYTGAVATIATSNKGSDPQYGLPGVSRARQPHQIQYQIDSGTHTRTLVSGIGAKERHAMRENIHGSPWDTRAWTFQEAALSPRIFLFSDHSVTFSCLGADAVEYQCLPASAPSWWSVKFTKSTALTGDRIAHLGMPIIVSLYARRKLTQSSDALNAFVGVLTAWSAASPRCYHYCGLPLRFPKALDDCSEPELYGTLWSSLCWRLKVGDARSAKRRDGFPRWSWLSVEGHIDVESSEYPCLPVSSLPYKLEVMTKEKGMMDWCQFVRTGGLSLSPFSWGSCLAVEGWLFSINILQQRTSFYVLAKNPKTSTATRLAFLPDVTSAMGFKTQYEAVAAYQNQVEHLNYAIVFERDGNSARRVGLLRLSIGTVPGQGIQPDTADSAGTFDIAEAFGAVRGRVCLE